MKIAAYLDSIEARIEARIEEITLLKKYKNAISSDIVTGKIDIRGIEIPEYEFVEENIDTETDESMEGMDGRTYEE